MAPPLAFINDGIGDRKGINATPFLWNIWKGIALLCICAMCFLAGYSYAHRELMDRMDAFAQREMQVEKIAKQQHDNAARGRR